MAAAASGRVARGLIFVSRTREVEASMALTVWSTITPEPARVGPRRSRSALLEDILAKARPHDRTAPRPPSASGSPGAAPRAAMRLNAREENERLILEAGESVFAELGFKGATTGAIAARAGLPKANVHYYFPSKDDLYRAVMARVLHRWLAAASSLDDSDDPEDALTRYITAKMELSRSMPLGSRIFASEIMRGAPAIADHLEGTLAHWVESRGAIVPVSILIALFQDRIVGGLTAGGTKG
jgi:AcrR family transcriptional regulator